MGRADSARLPCPIPSADLRGAALPSRTEPSTAIVPVAAPPEEPEESEESEPEAPPAKIVVREPTMDEMIAKLSSMGLAVVSVKMVETARARGRAAPAGARRGRCARARRRALS